MFQDSELQLAKLGEFLRLARKRRAWRQEDVAQRLKVSVDTIKRVEKGNKGVSIGIILDLFSLYQRLDAFSDVVNPYKDEVGISMETERSPKRISANRYDRDF